MGDFIMVFIWYIIAGLGVYCAAVHESSKLDRGDPPPAWLVFIWPIVYLLGLFDVIDWLVGRCGPHEK